ncbi:MAG: DUF6265 family protein [Gammaproteobacteria bacterium]
MSFRKTTAVLAFSLLTCAAGATFAGPPATVEDLSWMTGTWAGPFGPNTLEENWIEPKDGAIASMVRMSGNGSTSMYEVIIIEEKEGSLEMSIQQWGPNFEPTSEQAQKMELTDIGDKRVKFTAITEGTFEYLEYARPTEDTFTIDAGMGPTITLTAE